MSDERSDELPCLSEYSTTAHCWVSHCFLLAVHVCVCFMQTCVCVFVHVRKPCWQLQLITGAITDGDCWGKFLLPLSKPACLPHACRHTNMCRLDYSSLSAATSARKTQIKNTKQLFLSWVSFFEHEGKRKRPSGGGETHDVLPVGGQWKTSCGLDMKWTLELGVCVETQPQGELSKEEMRSTEHPKARCTDGHTHTEPYSVQWR